MAIEYDTKSYFPKSYLYSNQFLFLLSGLDIDGIYRVSGNLSHVQKLRYAIDRGKQ